MTEATERALARLTDLTAVADTDGHPAAAFGAVAGPAPSSAAAAAARRAGAPAPTLSARRCATTAAVAGSAMTTRPG